MGAGNAKEAPQEVKDVVEKYFEHFDLNKDGNITMDEIMEYHRKDWGAEFDKKEAEIRESVESDFKGWDKNGDKKISKEEMTIFWTKMFDKQPGSLKWVKF